MKRLNILFHTSFVLFLIFSPSARAQEAASSSQLHALSLKFAKEEVERYQFVQLKHVAALKRPLTSTGDFLFVREKGIVWHTATPFSRTMGITPNGIIEKGGKNSSPSGMAKSGSEAFTSVLFSLFGGNFTALENVFRLRLEGTPEANWSIILEPKSASVSKFLARIELSGAEHLEKLIIRESKGDWTELSFTPVEGVNELREDEKPYLEE